jgi:triacylglycerol lipase
MNTPTQNKRNELAVVLHGIGMNTLRMSYIAHRLSRAGYSVQNIGYPSTKRTIESSAEFVADKLQQHSNQYDKIHYIAHSMGCLITMQILADLTAVPTGRAVFIAPPYKGSEVADWLQDVTLYRRLFGPAGQQLTTHYRKEVHNLIPTDFEFGVISGTRGWEYPWFMPLMHKTGSHDGLVSLKSTEIEGAKDHITLRMSHSFLLEKSASHAIHFLEHGRFNENAERPYGPRTLFLEKESP